MEGQIVDFAARPIPKPQVQSGDRIFLVYVAYITDAYTDKYDIKRDRTWAYFFSEAEARACIEENWTDLYEHGYYNYAKLIELSPGLCRRDVRHRKDWYHVEYPANSDLATDPKVVPCEVPISRALLVGGIG